MDYAKILEIIKNKSYDRMSKVDPHSVEHEADNTINGKYTDRKYSLLNYAHWTRSFFTGTVALLYKHYGDQAFLDYLKELDGVYQKRLKYGIDVRNIHHDAGFTYILYSNALYEVAKDKRAYNLSLKAADELLKTYRPEVGIIQGFGGPTGDTITIADDMMNIGLFMWAYEKTKHPFYKRIFTNHINTILDIMVRDDFSIRHSYLFDETGKPIGEHNYCGYGVGSMWARGNAWVIYGLTNAITCLYHDLGMDYKTYIARDAKLKLGQRKCVTEDRALARRYAIALNGILNCFISHLPENGIPMWDMKELSKEIGDVHDTSAAVIFASAIYKLNEYYDISSFQGVAKHAVAIADKIMESVTNEYFAPADAENFIEGGQCGPRECGCVWGDYFYTEAIMRKLYGKDAPEFWSKPVMGVE